jgi:hypothetical protein
MTAPQSSPPPHPDEAPSIGEVVDLVKTYAKQETLGPLKGAGKWLAFGAAGAALLGLGLSLVTLGVLRLVQAEWDRAARGSLSWLAYLIALVVCVAFLVLALTRINKDSLEKETP